MQNWKTQVQLIGSRPGRDRRRITVIHGCRGRPIKKPRFISAQPQRVSSSPRLSASLIAPAHCLSPFPSVGTLQQQLILAIIQAGTSGKLQSKSIFNAVDMLVQIADRLQVDNCRLSIVEYLYLFDGRVEVHSHKIFPAIAV